MPPKTLPQTTPEPIAIFGGSFNPPGIHHLKLVETFLKTFSKVIVVPCGLRPEKFPLPADFIPDSVRGRLIQATFKSIDSSNIELDFRDIESGQFTATVDLYHLYRHRCEPWFVVGADLFAAPVGHQSEIQTSWKEGKWIWEKVHFACLQRPGFSYDTDRLPPNHCVIPAKISGSSSLIRTTLRNRLPIRGMVVPEVARILEETGAYLSESTRL